MSSLKLKIQTNLPVSRAMETTVISEASALLSREMSFPSGSVTSSLESNTRLVLADSHAPAAFVEVRSAQLPPQGRVLGQALAAVIHQHLSIAPGRVYVRFVSSSAETLSRTAAA